ncbi:MAG: hypothetical protein LBF27_10130 [Sphingobacterium sp.]|jgi:hypothetical protein|nr:hypothetical protein [Sphingobacterium sp.]
MEKKVRLKGNKLKVLDGFWENDEIMVIMILLILFYSISGKTKSVELNKIAFVIDAVKKSVEMSKFSIALAEPWEISDSLRKRLILAFKKGLLTIQDKNGKVSFALTAAGNELVSTVEKDKILPHLTESIKLWSNAVSISQLKNQQLTW